MKEQKFYWLLLWGILLTEGFLIYQLSDMMYVVPTQTVTVLEKEVDNHVDESVDEDMYRTLWYEEKKTNDISGSD
jgi:hypothetical protein